MEKNQHLSLNNKENKQEKKHKRYIYSSLLSVQVLIEKNLVEEQ